MYYYSENGETSGPISETDLQARIAAGSLPAAVNVWREGMAGWLPYNQVNSAAGAPPAARTPLRVNVAPTAVAAAPVQTQPEYAMAGGGDDSSADVQGSSRFESASSWGMVVIVGLAMVVFIGILASKPRDLVYANSAVEAVDPANAIDAAVELKAGVLHIENASEFPWGPTSISFRSGGQRYVCLLTGLPKEGSVSVPLTDFASLKGGKFSSTSNPRELSLRVKDHGSVTVEIDVVP